MTPSITLPTADGTTVRHVLAKPREWPRPTRPFRSRVALAAAHVVADPLADNTPGAPAAIDWEHTLAFRRHLWGYGLGLAEAMDTAQRGMGLDWATTAELVRRSATEASALGTRIAAGAGTDHLEAPAATLEDVANAYEHQISTVQDTGAQVILMASRHLAAVAKTPEDYRTVYDRIIPLADSPIILHWLGPMFDPALRGYWGSADVSTATDHVVELIRDHAGKIDGVKVSLLDDAHEKAFRARLPGGVRLYTGDDFNYPDLIRGDGRIQGDGRDDTGGDDGPGATPKGGDQSGGDQSGGADAGYSDALLGIFAAIAPAASAALQALDDGDDDAYDAAFAPTVPLARHVFAAPTYYYKTGIAFLAWLSGFQPGFTMVGGLQSARSLPHLVQTFRLADAAQLFPDPDLAAARMSTLLKAYGVVA